MPPLINLALFTLIMLALIVWTGSYRHQEGASPGSPRARDSSDVPDPPMQ